MAQQTDPRILGTEPIGKLLLQYSIPAIIGMTITSLYNKILPTHQINNAARVIFWLV